MTAIARSPAGLRMEIGPLLGTDAPAIHLSLLGDPEVAAWFRAGGPFTLAEREEMVARKVAHRTVHRFGWSLGWEGETCVGWSVAQYTRHDNLASRGVMTKLGMNYEKSFDLDGGPHVLYRKSLAGS